VLPIMSNKMLPMEAFRQARKSNFNDEHLKPTREGK
jgi:hypothetical protein